MEVLLLLLEVVLPHEEFVVGGEERLRLLLLLLLWMSEADWDLCSLELAVDWEAAAAAGCGGEACPFNMFMRWWRRHLARLLENQT